MLMILTEKVANELQIAVKKIIEYANDNTSKCFFGMFRRT
jgi:hypothetical protein